MDQASLVETDISLGEALLKRLDKRGFSVASALWFFIPESNEWRLILATPLVDEVGPRATYLKIAQSEKRSSAHQKVPLERISVVSTNHPVISALSAMIRVDGIGGVRFTNNSVNGIFIADAYLYRSV